MLRLIDNHVCCWTASYFDSRVQGKFAELNLVNHWPGYGALSSHPEGGKIFKKKVGFHVRDVILPRFVYPKHLERRKMAGLFVERKLN